MGFVLGFLPWIVYWVLVGNAPFRLAVTVAFAVVAAGLLLARSRGVTPRTLDLGNLGVFALLVVAAFVLPDPFLERWLQPLGNAGLLLIALVGLLIGRPFVREYATASVDAVTARTDGFRVITTAMTWLWVAVFAAMTVSALIPPLVEGSASLADGSDTLSVICYWVVPFALTGAGGLLSGLFPGWFEHRSALVDQRSVPAEPAANPPDPPPDLSVPTLELDLPARSRHDEPFPVVLRGVPAGRGVELTTGGTDLAGRAWRSVARFIAPESGTIDTRVLAPTGGDWAHAGTDAPLWAMRFADAAVPELFVPPPVRWPVTVTADVGGPAESLLVRRTVPRDDAAPEVRAAAVRIEGLPGVLALPAGEPPAAGWPGVACFGGSEGGHDSQVVTAALLASHGFAALAATWIEEADARTAIAEVPLERFDAVLSWLAARDEVTGPVAAMGISRGAEGLLAAVCSGPGPDPGGLVLVSPSSVCWQAMGSGGEIPGTASWTRDGRPLPWAALPTGELMPQLIRNAWRVRRDAAARRPGLLRLRPAYARGLEKAPEPAAIPAERARCPLLCLTGADDRLWPAPAMADALLARRGDAADRHVSYPGAGHLIRLGALPTDAAWTGGIDLGGSRAGIASAQRDAIGQVLRFLHARAAAAAVTSGSG